jgi:hypothetical protein
MHNIPSSPHLIIRGMSPTSPPPILVVSRSLVYMVVWLPEEGREPAEKPEHTALAAEVVLACKLGISSASS